MKNENLWEKSEVVFSGSAYEKKNKKVVKGPNYGFITVPKRLIGKNVRIILIEEEVQATTQ